MKKRLLFLLYMAALLTTVQAQKVMINGVEGDRLLTWSDFKGEPDKGSPYFANTAWTTMYLDQVKFTDSVALLTSFQFTLMLDPKGTWLKPGKGSDALLKHEQGHFDVGYLYMQEVVKNIKTASFSRQNFQKELEAFIAKIHQKYTDLNKQYDEKQPIVPIKRHRKNGTTILIRSVNDRHLKCIAAMNYSASNAC